jgi:hypothetical protein
MMAADGGRPSACRRRESAVPAFNRSSRTDSEPTARSGPSAEAGNRTLWEKAEDEAAQYRRGEERPLRGYVVVLATFAGLIVGAAGLLAATGRRLPRQIGPYDLLLLTAGAHKISRTLSKDAVTSPLRAPFTRFDSPGGPAEVMEQARHDSSLRHAVGELLTCPFCLDMWVATGLVLGLVFAPRLTRMVATTFTVLTGADLLHLGYALAQRAVQEGGE